MHQRVSQKRRRGPLLARLRASPQYAPRLITVDAPPQFLNKSYVDGLAARFFDPAYQAACNANTVFFELMLRNARRLHPDKNLSTLTLLAIFGTDNPSLINAIPREEFIDRVNAKKQDLGITPKPTNPRVKRQAEKRVRQDMSPEQRKAPRRRPNHRTPQTRLLTCCTSRCRSK